MLQSTLRPSVYIAADLGKGAGRNRKAEMKTKTPGISARVKMEPGSNFVLLAAPMGSYVGSCSSDWPQVCASTQLGKKVKGRFADAN